MPLGSAFTPSNFGFILQPLAVGNDVFALRHILAFYLLAMENLALLLISITSQCYQIFEELRSEIS